MVNYREERKLDKTNGKLSNNYQEQTKDGKVLIDLKKLIIFIAGVINATTETKSKTEKDTNNSKGSCESPKPY